MFGSVCRFDDHVFLGNRSDLERERRRNLLDFLFFPYGWILKLDFSATVEWVKRVSIWEVYVNDRQVKRNFLQRHTKGFPYPIVLSRTLVCFITHKKSNDKGHSKGFLSLFCDVPSTEHSFLSRQQALMDWHCSGKLLSPLASRNSIFLWLFLRRENFIALPCLHCLSRHYVVDVAFRKQCLLSAVSKYDLACSHR